MTGKIDTRGVMQEDSKYSEPSGGPVLFLSYSLLYISSEEVGGKRFYSVSDSEPVRMSIITCTDG